MYYIFGDIHGCYNRLLGLFDKLEGIIKDDDILVFLGDYIDRGTYSYEVIEYLISISGRGNKTIFLKGNHEDMFLKYLRGEDSAGIYLDNGGGMTLQSYKKNCGRLKIPQEHQKFFQNLQLYYEKDDFISVHAGFNPKVYNIEQQLEKDILWIREEFYRAERRWDKTIIFGHTPCIILGRKLQSVYFDEGRNIIGIDTGAVYGGVLTCLRWPDREIYQC